MEYTEPPPAEEVEHRHVDPKFAADLRAARLADKPATVTYTAGGDNTVSGTKL